MLKDHSVIGKLMICGDLVLETPLIIGGGDNENGVDKIVVKDEHNSPYIPATAFTGAMRGYFFSTIDLTGLSGEELAQAEYFWGSSKAGAAAAKGDNDLLQSALKVSDCMPAPDRPVSVLVRDGVAIDPGKGIAIDKKKYDYELVDAGAGFKLCFEVTVRRINEEAVEILKRFTAYLVHSLEQEKIRLGAMTGKGFGRCRLVNARFYEFNFNQPEHVLAWLSKEEDRWPESELPLSEGLQKKSRDMSITASFRIKTSLIVRSYSSRSEEPDAIHIRSNGKNIMPGTSIKGALRGRASRILNTMGAADDLLIKDMFGWVDDELPGKNTAIRGRFLVEETVIDNVLSSIRSRVRIDRFTGGASSGALFDNKPLWPKDGEKIKMVELKLTLKEYQDWEAGLVLMLLKDLWTGDLPLGGEKSIGRGVLQGIDAQINVGDNRYSLKDIDGHKFIFEGNPEELEGLAAALQSKISCQGVAANG